MIYIASPYSHSSGQIRKERYLAARKFLSMYMNNGLICYSPIAHSIGLANNVKAFDENYFNQLNTEFLKKSDSLTVLCLDGWEDDKFVRSCIVYAHKHNMPVLYKNIDGEDIYKSKKKYTYTRRKRVR